MNVEINKKGIMINGEYKILLCSSLFYFRIPQEKWLERMLLLKKAGYNAIDVYCPWNYHEVEPDIWNFKGQRDISKFLELAKQQNLYVILRPGPYICSEWDGGGLPAWLLGKSIRQDDEDFINSIFVWYDHLFSIIKHYLITNSGTVIMMQIENELDFYNCISPSTYVDKLRKYSQLSKIDIPLFCCCGQNSIERSGALASNLYTTFNIYSPAKTPFLEKRLNVLYKILQKNNLPLLVTETNRSHSYLKRLLISGTKLLSPYNQTAGTTTEYYNGITNWGDRKCPIKLMATDYDFNSMIGSAGDVNKEFYEARIFSSIINFFGPEIAKARPSFNKNCFDNNEKLPSLILSNGELILVSNLTNSKVEKVIKIDNKDVIINLKEEESKILPYHYKLSCGLMINSSNCELFNIETIDSIVNLFFVGIKTLNLNISINGKQYEYSINEKLTRIYNYIIHFDTIENSAKNEIGELKELPFFISEQELKSKIKSIELYTVKYDYLDTKVTKIKTMEKMEQYRKTSSYRCKVDADCQLLILNPADIIIKKKDNEFLSTYYADGSSRIEKAYKGRYEWICEIWGHSNFNDIRVPALDMKSQKGLSGICKISNRFNITDDWDFDFDNFSNSMYLLFRQSPYHAIVSIDNYFSSNRPFKGIYHKTIDLELFRKEIDDKLFLYIENLDSIIQIYLNGKLVGVFPENEHYFDLSNYLSKASLIDLVLRVERMDCYCKVGKVELITGCDIKECKYSELISRAGLLFDKKTFPISLKNGNEVFIKPQLNYIPTNDCKFRFKGKNMRLTVFFKNKCIGRHVLDNNIFPETMGGENNVCMICKEWFADFDQLYIYCQAISDDAELVEIDVKEYKNLSL